MNHFTNQEKLYVSVLEDEKFDVLVGCHQFSISIKTSTVHGLSVRYDRFTTAKRRTASMI